MGIPLPGQEGAGLNLGGAVVQVHSGNGGNAQSVVTFYPGTNQVRDTTVYQNPHILLERRKGEGDEGKE